MLGRLFERPAPAMPDPRALTAWGDWSLGGYASAAGVTVNTSTAAQLLAVYGSVRLIADQISTLPVDCYRTTGGEDDAKVEVTPPRWLVQPTPSLSFVDWCGQVLWSLLMAGNAYIAVLRTGATITELAPLDPTAVTPERVNSRLRYRVNGVLYPGEIVHVKGLMASGADVGLSPLESARQSIGLGLAAQEYGSKLFTNEGNMPGVIELPGKATTEHLRDIALSWQRRRASGGRGMPGVLDGGATWKPTAVTNEQAQCLQTRQWTAAEIAGQVYLLDPSDLGIPVAGTSLTYANLSDRNARRVQVALLPWIVRVERAVSDLLAAPRFMRFNLDGLLRGNLAERMSAYEAAERINASATIRGDAPFMPTGEMRDLEDMPPLDPVTPAPGADQ